MRNLTLGSAGKDEASWGNGSYPEAHEVILTRQVRDGDSRQREKV